MKEKPIIFSAPMIKAILEDRKSQTRRIIKPQGSAMWQQQTPSGDMHWFTDVRHERGPTTMISLPCAAGDLLWVKENFVGARGYDDLPPSKWGNKPVWFSADGEPDRKLWWHLSDKTRPSIFMPRELSRLTLKVTGVKVERLNSISEEDAMAEGCKGCLGPNPDFPDEWDPSPEEEFQELWNSIHGPGAWEANPWICAIGFERVSA